MIQLPIGAENDYAGHIDLVRMKAVIWDGEQLGASFSYVDIPAELQDKAAEYREKLIELAVEQDDAAMEAYLEGNEPDINTLKTCIRKGTVNNVFVPVLCGTAFKNKGVQTMLDAVVEYLPSPTDIGAVHGVDIDDPDKEDSRLPKDDSPFSALAFKIMNDPFVGSLTFARIYSGTLQSGSYVQNTIKDKRERIGRMLLMHSNNREEIKDTMPVTLLRWLV